MFAILSMRPLRHFFLFVLLLLLLSFFVLPHVKANPIQLTYDIMGGMIKRVSVASDGTEGNGPSYVASISESGRYVAGWSAASNLVANDTNLHEDVFVHDSQTGETIRVSIASDGTQGNNYSLFPAISGDGRYVAFQSYATNLVSNDTNNTLDIFVYDRQTGETTRASVASDGSQGEGYSSYSAISADGRYVAFYSEASNLVTNDTNGIQDMFVHDRQTGETTRVSIASDDTQSNGVSFDPSISADGRYVAFHSHASNLVANDTNGRVDIFVHDRQTGETARVSIASDGTQSNGQSEQPYLSGDGRYVAFHSSANNLVANDTNGQYDIFVHDRNLGQTIRVSVGLSGTQSNNFSSYSSISGDGRYVAFYSDASNLVVDDTNGTRDIFVHDRQMGETTRISIASDGAQSNGASAQPSISRNGYYVAFHSVASNLVPDDTNGVHDVFLRDRGEQPNVTPTATATSTPIPSPTATVTNTPRPTKTPVPPTATPTQSGSTTYTGTLPGTGANAYHPSAGYSSAAGTHTGDLVGPPGTDFDLYLQRWNGLKWVTVASSLSPNSTEFISYTGTDGTYRWRVSSFSGSGSYTLVTTRPAALVEGGFTPTPNAPEDAPVTRK